MKTPTKAQFTKERYLLAVNDVLTVTTSKIKCSDRNQNIIKCHLLPIKQRYWHHLLRHFQYGIV